MQPVPPSLVLLFGPPVTDGAVPPRGGVAVCVAVRVAVAGCRSVGGRGEAVAGLCLRDCKNEYTFIRIARLMTFNGSLTKRGDGEPGGEPPAGTGVEGGEMDRRSGIGGGPGWAGGDLVRLRQGRLNLQVFCQLGQRGDPEAECVHDWRAF